MEKITLSPTKGAYNAIKADVGANASVKELVDNAADNGSRRGRDIVTVTIYVETDGEGKLVLVVRDDSGGLTFDELSMIFALGESEKDDIKGSIGAFGIGAPKALMSLGEEFTVRTRHSDADTGYAYTVDQKWLDDEDDWTVPVEEVDMDAGTTEIRISDLNFTWTDVRTDLKADLRTTYAPYLRGHAPVTLQIRFPTEDRNDLESLSAPPRPAYSYTPWDALYPRRYEGIVLDPDDVDEHVAMSVEVGLLATGDPDEAGVDWVCQHRVVERANRDTTSGFGVGGVLPKFRESTHKRLKTRVELYTPGDASALPWNSDKSRIRERDPVTDAARDILGKVLGRYMRAGYGSVEPAFFEPYTGDSRYAANDGTVAVVDLSDKYRRFHAGDITQIQINDKPDEGFPQVEDMQATAAAHAELGVTYKYLDWMKPWMRPTYHALVEHLREKQGRFEELTELGTAPPDFTVEGRSGESEAARLTNLAAEHANQGVRYTGLSQWEEPRYTLELEQAAEERDLDVDAFEPVAELPEVDGVDTDEEDDVTQVQLTFGPFSEEDLSVLDDHLGDIKEFSPEKRREVLVGHFKRLNMAGVRFEAHAD